MREKLQALAKEGGKDPRSILSVRELFGDDLRGDQRFLDEVTKAMELITKDGVMETIPKYVN
jgi:mannitol 2-dehydrogenase